ncbi:MAG: Gx transporter family protein [Bacilli bacterium]|nr:Gx transporter family protein [Bacilli bacterium]MBN2877289.1 Gx transporter family protein [Bacilli bacterium]
MSTRKLVFLALMVTISIVLSIVESVLSASIFAFPGIKLGLANIATLVVLFTMSRKEAATVAILRILLVGLIYSGLFSPTFLISLGGGLLALISMLLLKGTKLSIYTVSVLGSLMHMIGQIAIAIGVVHTTSLIYYLPYMMIVSVPTGLITGYLANWIIHNFSDRIMKY